MCKALRKRNNIKTNNMEAKELIKILQSVPSDTPIRVLNINDVDDRPNEWVVKVEEENEDNDYHTIILLTSE